MYKRFLSILLCGMLFSLSMLCLSGCGKEKDDFIQQGLSYIEEGQYEKARTAFQKAAQEDPEDIQAKECFQIVDAYLKAEEAHALDDDEAAAEYLKDLPERYQNLAIAEDIDTLLRSLKSSLPDAKDAEEEDEDAPKSTQRANTTTAPSGGNADIFSAQEQIDLQLQEAESLLNAGLYDEAMETLNQLNMNYAKNEQKTKYNSLKDQIEEKQTQANANEASYPDQSDFTSEKAVEYLQKEYPIEGDLGELPPKYDENNRKYYEIPLAYNGETITVRVFADGTVVRIH